MKKSFKTLGPGYEISVLIRFVSCQGSDKPMQLFCLFRALAVHTHEKWKWMKGTVKPV